MEEERQGPLGTRLSKRTLSALARNRTRVNCLEGSYAHHYTTNAPRPTPASCSSTPQPRLPPAPPLPRLPCLLLFQLTNSTLSTSQPGRPPPSSPLHTHGLKPIGCLWASLCLTCWLGKLNLLPDGNADAPHLPSYSCPLGMYYATRWAFLWMYLSCFKHRQTPTQLLTTFPTLRGMRSTENRMTNRMAQDKHKDMP